MSERRPYHVSCFVPGRPVGYVRMTQGTKFGADAQRYLQSREGIGWAAKAAGAEPVECPVAVSIIVVLEDPDGKRADADNYLKGTLDALNKVAFADDKQVRGATVWISRANPHFEDEGMWISVYEVAG